MKMYTIKSTSEDGIYYLCNHWNENRTYWIKENRISKGTLFKKEENAKASLKKLLKVMPEYMGDIFELVAIEL